MDDSGWNFRTAQYHEGNQRTLFKAYGLKFLLNVRGNGGKFDLTKTVIIIVTGIGLMGLANILCDILLLNCSSAFRKQVVEKKYESIIPEINEDTIGTLKNIIANQELSNDIVNSVMTISSLAIGPEPMNSSRFDQEDSTWV